MFHIIEEQLLALFVVLFVVALDLGASVAFVFGASVFGVVVVVDFVEGVKDFVVLAGALNPPPPDFAFAMPIPLKAKTHTITIANIFLKFIIHTLFLIVIFCLINSYFNI